jgi:hypothetical protein
MEIPAARGRIILGTFATLDEAAHDYDTTAWRLGCPTAT